MSLLIAESHGLDVCNHQATDLDQINTIGTN